MDPQRFEKLSPTRWQLPARGPMRVPAVIFATEELLRDMDDKVAEQLCNVAALPGIVGAALAMPDAHWGYGFPIGGVAAFDADLDGVVSAGGVGFDISCGVRLIRTPLDMAALAPQRETLADHLYYAIPAGVGSTGVLRLDATTTQRMLSGGAQWAVEAGYGDREDLARIEEQGRMPGADPEAVSERARRRQRDEMGTLGSGNHYLEVQRVAEIFDADRADAFGLRREQIVISIHCGSRGLGHQIGTEFLQDMAPLAHELGITMPDRELACAPIRSELGQRYLGAMRAAMNCAMANRQILTHLARRAFTHVFGHLRMPLLYDVSHNTCKQETHTVQGRPTELYVHRKGATRAFGPGHPELPEALRAQGQPVLIGGSMGTSSYVLAGMDSSANQAFSSACHGAGRAMSRHQATRTWRGRELQDELAQRGILVRSPSLRGIAEEAPGAYKDVDIVVRTAEEAGLARLVARLEPVVCIKG